MKKSAGILIYRITQNYAKLTQNLQKNTEQTELTHKGSASSTSIQCNSANIEVFLVHPGGHFWQNKDLNSWSIPKGEIENNEELKIAAIREFEEETGLKLTEEDKNKIFYLGEVKSSNKIVYVFALEKDFGDNFEIKSNLIKIDNLEFPEVDKAEYFDLRTAKEKLVKYQKPIIDILISNLKLSKNIQGFSKNNI